jgi:hypothetical protein
VVCDLPWFVICRGKKVLPETVSKLFIRVFKICTFKKVSPTMNTTMNVVQDTTAEASVVAVNTAIGNVVQKVRQATQGNNPYTIVLNNTPDRTDFSCTTVDDDTGMETIASVRVNVTTVHTVQSRSLEVLRVSALAAGAGVQRLAHVRKSVADVFDMAKKHTMDGARTTAGTMAKGLKRTVGGVCRQALRLVGDDTESAPKRARVPDSPAAGDSASSSASDSGQTDAPLASDSGQATSVQTDAPPASDSGQAASIAYVLC